MGISTASGAKAKADKLFSQIIRFHGSCERCDYRCPWECDASSGQHRKGCKLQCAHIITRHRNNTRTDLRNAVALCAGCHHYFGLFPVDFGLWILDRMDLATYTDLTNRANRRSSVKWETEVERLSGEWTALRLRAGLD